LLKDRYISASCA